MLGKDGAVGVVVAGGEHFFDIGGGLDAPAAGAIADVGQDIGRGGQHDDWLARDGQMSILIAVFIGLANHFGIGPDDAAHQKGGD